MKTPDEIDGRIGPPDPEKLLQRGLRETTPEFEARFDALRRGLAAGGRPAWWARAWHDMVLDRRTWIAGTTMAALVLAWGYAVRRSPPDDPWMADRARWYAEVMVLEEALHGALALTHEETREAMSWMPVEPLSGGES